MLIQIVLQIVIQIFSLGVKIFFSLVVAGDM